MRELISHGKVNAAHDVADGGVLIAAVEMALAGNLGCLIDYKTSDWEHSDIALLFGEDQGRFLVTAPSSEMLDFRAEDFGLTAFRIGEVGGSSVAVDSPTDVQVPLTDLREASDSFFRDWMGSGAGLDASDLSGN